MHKIALTFAAVSPTRTWACGRLLMNRPAIFTLWVAVPMLALPMYLIISCCLLTLDWPRWERHEVFSLEDDSQSVCGWWDRSSMTRFNAAYKTRLLDSSSISRQIEKDTAYLGRGSLRSPGRTRRWFFFLCCLHSVFLTVGLNSSNRVTVSNSRRFARTRWTRCAKRSCGTLTILWFTLVTCKVDPIELLLLDWLIRHDRCPRDVGWKDAA